MRRLLSARHLCVLRTERVTADDRARFKGLSHDEMLVFQLIQQSGNMGTAHAHLRCRVACRLS